MRVLKDVGHPPGLVIINGIRLHKSYFILYFDIEFANLTSDTFHIMPITNWEAGRTRIELLILQTTGMIIKGNFDVTI